MYDVCIECMYACMYVCMYVDIKCLYVWYELERGNDEIINEEKERLWEMVRILLGAGAVKDRVNKRGETALHTALREKNLTAVHALAQDAEYHMAATAVEI